VTFAADFIGTCARDGAIRAGIGTVMEGFEHKGMALAYIRSGTNDLGA
jgi:hypothetical protein